MKTLHLTLFLSFLIYASSTQSQTNSRQNLQNDKQESLTLWHGLSPLGNEKVLADHKIKQSFYELSYLFETMDAWRHSMYLPHSQQVLWQTFREDIQEHTTEAVSYTHLTLPTKA